MAETDKLYIIRTKTDIDGDGVIEYKTKGVFTSEEAAQACVEEIKGRYDVQRHNVTTSMAEISVTAIEPNKYYENI